MYILSMRWRNCRCVADLAWYLYGITEKEILLVLIFEMKKLLFAFVTLFAWGAAYAATDVEIASVTKKYYPLGWCDVTLVSAEDEDIRYQLSITTTQELESGHTYTNLTGGKQNLANGSYINLSSGDYTETVGADGSLTIEVHLNLVDHTKENLHYYESGVPVAKDTVSVSLDNSVLREASTSLGDPVIVVAGSDEHYAMSLSFLGDQLRSTYTNDDVYAYFTHMTVDGEEVVIRNVSATATSTLTDFAVDAYVLGDDAHCYHALLSYTLPEAKDTVSIAATNMLIDESKINQLGEVIFSASDKNYIVELWLEGENPIGHFGHRTLDKVSSMVESAAGAVKTSLLSVDVDVVLEGNVTHLTGSVLGENLTRYMLDLTYTRPTEPTRELTLDMEGAIDMARLSEEGTLYMVGTDRSQLYQLSLMAYVAELSGEITEAQMDTYETFLKVYDQSGVMVDIFDLLEAKLTLSLQDDYLTVEGTMFLQSEEMPADAPLLHITMGAVCETGRALDNSEEDFYGILPNYVVDPSRYLSEGILVLNAADADTTRMAAVAFYPGNVDPAKGIPEGVYTISDSHEVGTVAIAPEISEGQLYPSFCALTYANGEPQVPLWFLMEGTVTVKKVDGNLSVRVNALNSFNRHIEVAIGEVQMDTVLVDMNDCELVVHEEEETFQFLGQSTRWEAYVAIDHAFAPGTYDWADAIHDYCRVRTLGTSYISATDLTATVSEARNGYDCEAYLTCENAVVYRIVFHYYWDDPVATPFEEKTIVAHNAKVDDIWSAEGYWIIDAANDAQTIQITFEAEEPRAYTSATLNHEFTYLVNNETGSILRTYGGEGVWNPETQVLTGYLIGKDGVRYNLELNNTTALPTIHDQAAATKHLEHGTIVIVKNGVRYSVMGVRL